MEDLISSVDTLQLGSNYPYVIIFRGKILCTEPTLLLGRIFMEELIEYLDRAPR